MRRPYLEYTVPAAVLTLTSTLLACGEDGGGGGGFANVLPAAPATPVAASTEPASSPATATAATAAAVTATAPASRDHRWGPLFPEMIASGRLPADVPPDSGYITDAAQARTHAELGTLVPGAVHVTRTYSGHEIHKQQPKLVIDAARTSSILKPTPLANPLP